MHAHARAFVHARTLVGKVVSECLIRCSSMITYWSFMIHGS